MRKLFGLVALGLVLDVVLVIVLSGVLGVLPMVGWSILSAVLGAGLALAQGRRVLGQWREALGLAGSPAGRPPDEGVVGSVLLVLGGILLCLPGVLTDVAGVVLLVPFTRRRVADAVRGHLERRFLQSDAGAAAPGPEVTASVGGPRAATWGEWAEPRARAEGMAVIDVEGHAVDDEPQNERLLPPKAAR